MGFASLMNSQPEFWDQFGRVEPGGFTGGVSQTQPVGPAVTGPTVGGQPSLADFERDYWAPDREQVLASMRAAPAAPAAGVGGSRPGIDQFEQAWLSSGGRTVADLQNFVAQHPEYGVKLGGSKGDKIYGPGGEFWADGVISAGLGGRGATFDRGTGGGGGDAGAAGGGAFGALLTPFDKQYTLPTQADLEAMPGYQAAQAAAMRGVQSSAAARGTLLTGGTQKALQDRAGEVASQGYAQLAGLGMNAFGINKDTFYQNQNNPFSKLLSTSQLGYQAASQPTAGASTSGYTPYPTAAQTNFVKPKGLAG